MFLWVENAVILVKSCLLIIKALKIQDGCQIYYVNSYILGRHDLSEAISKMLAVKNGKKPSLGISKLGLLVVMDLQYLPLNIGFTIYTYRNMFLGYWILLD